MCKKLNFSFNLSAQFSSRFPCCCKINIVVFFSQEFPPSAGLCPPPPPGTFPSPPSSAGINPFSRKAGEFKSNFNDNFPLYHCSFCFRDFTNESCKTVAMLHSFLMRISEVSDLLCVAAVNTVTDQRVQFHILASCIFSALKFKAGIDGNEPTFLKKCKYNGFL